ncbi:MAG: hypothetical protein QOH56_4071 [Pseudonocardiales bacterium]|jgi:hypothetical protein|nr:hypothetical protein [Pseudonocardiales bacterium]
MRKVTKLMTAVAFAGLAAASAAGFTGTGITDATGGSQFIGGTVSQSVTGATLTGVVYNFVGGSTGPKTNISSIDLSFSGADGKAVDVAANGLAINATFSGNGTADIPGTVAVGGGVHFVVTAIGGAAAGYAGLSSLAITVR